MPHPRQKFAKARLRVPHSAQRFMERPHKQRAESVARSAAQFGSEYGQVTVTMRSVTARD